MAARLGIDLYAPSFCTGLVPSAINRHYRLFMFDFLYVDDATCAGCPRASAVGYSKLRAGDRAIIAKHQVEPKRRGLFMSLTSRRRGARCGIHALPSVSLPSSH